MLSLRVREGAHPGTIYRLGTRVLTVGRDQRNPIQLIDPEISRRHAQIRWTGGGYLLTDLQSQNGTYVADALVREKELRAGDVIRFGKTVLDVIADARGGPDGVLGGKVVRTVARALTVPSEELERDSDGVVDLDADASRRAMRLARLTTGLKDVVKSGRHRTLIYKQAMEGLMDVLGPDRVAIFKVAAAGKTEVEASATVPQYQAVHAETPLALAAVARAVRSGSSVVGEDETSSVGDVEVQGWVVAVPIKDGNRVVGLLYVDSLLGHEIRFVRQDLEILEPIARVLLPSFIKGQG